MAVALNTKNQVQNASSKVFHFFVPLSKVAGAARPVLNLGVFWATLAGKSDAENFENITDSRS